MIVVVGVPAVSDAPEAQAVGVAAGVALAAAAAGARAELVGRVGDDPAGDRLLFALSRGGVGHAAILRDPSRPTPVLRAPAIDPDEDAEAQPWSDPTDDAPEPRSSTARSADAAHAAAAADPEAAAAASMASGPILDPADVELGLRYLTDARVVVLADPATDAMLEVAGEAAAYLSASLVVLVASDAVATAAARVVADATVIAMPPGDGAGPFATIVGRFAAALDRGEAPGPAFELALEAVGGTRAR